MGEVVRIADLGEWKTLAEAVRSGLAASMSSHDPRMAFVIDAISGRPRHEQKRLVCMAAMAEVGFLTADQATIAINALDLRDA